ncbi:MAG: DNA alkylation repair protein [Anaerolineales bacterium]|nr:DNA alkylation repair protein [Anaerolineales bacterium]
MRKPIPNEPDWLLEACFKLFFHLGKTDQQKVLKFAARFRNASRKSTQRRARMMLELKTPPFPSPNPQSGSREGKGGVEEKSDMNSADADRIGESILQMILDGETAGAHALLAPHLSRRIPFRLLDRIGTRIGAGPVPAVNGFLARIAREKPMGGWPLIGSALAAQLEADFEGALERCRGFIVFGDAWYAADTLAERVPGAALVTDFNRALPILKRWRTDEERWVRKSCGVAVHLWTKRAHGDPRLLPKVKTLLAFLAPMFGEEDLDAVKGIGWALKTIGRFYPETLTPWLIRQVGRRASYRPLMLRKAVTYLNPEDRNIAYRAACR